MPSANKGGKGKIAGFFVWLVQSSVILSALDRFTSYIYELLKNGLFGYIFTGYKSDTVPHSSGKSGDRKFSAHFAELRYGICRRIESSAIINGVSFLMRYFLGCRMKVYGAFLASFGAYTAVSTTIIAALEGKLNSILDDPAIFISVLTVFSSLAFVMSKRTLSDAILNSYSGRLILALTGFGEEEVKKTEGTGGHMSTAFVLGLILGAMTYFVSPVMLILLCAGVICAYLVLIKPEIGVAAMFFIAPFMDRSIYLAAIVAYTTVCYLIKLFRGKRMIRLEAVDIMVLAFAVLMFFGGVISLSDLSFKPALLMTCMTLGYFLTVQLITSREWLVRCSSACIISATLVAIYGIFLYFTGGGYSSGAWVDTDRFTAISARAVSTLENPNMLGEYLILIIPIAFANFVGRGEGLKRFEALFCIAVMGACLILTWSRGAWLGLVFALLVFLFMWHRRSMWLVIAGVASLPFVIQVLPASIVNRITSIGDLSDSSTSYRVFIWKAAVDMISDNPFSGIGVGEGAWDRIYPLYAYNGIEAAPHSHNLFLQIWLEIGFVGLLVFVAAVFLLFQAAFTFFEKLSDKNTRLETPDISETALRVFSEDAENNKTSSMKKGKIQLRVSTVGPLCGIIAVLVQGMTDYAWYNYRLYLMFWLVAGLAAAYVRSGRQLIETPEDYLVYDKIKCETEMKIRKKEKNKKLPKGQADE